MSLSPEQISEIKLTNIDTSDCAVVALQAITGLGRSRCVKLAAKHGYREGVGTPRGSIEAALADVGYEATEVYDKMGGQVTPATFAVSHEYGVFIVYVERHVMALVEGDLHNSKGSWRMPVDSIWKVERR